MKMLVETCSYVARSRSNGSKKEVTNSMLGAEVNEIEEDLLSDNSMRLVLKSDSRGGWVIHGTVLCVDDEGYPL